MCGILSAHLCKYMCVYALSVCVCLSAHLCKYRCVYALSVCVCVCVRARERGRARVFVCPFGVKI